MIIATRKNIRELKQVLAAYQKIAVLGCGTCVTICLAGGEREAGMTASALRMTYRLDGEEKGIRDLTIERQCEDAFIDEAWKNLDEADAILSLACGAGVQAIAERFPNKPVFPGVDTQFIGILEEQGVWTEKCVACGECRIGLFGGICPVARCAKHLLNGPCGGSHDGKCEADAQTDCAWQLIYDRLKAIGEEERLEELVALPDWSLSNEGGCRKIVREDQRI
jgi:ferredoxin